MVYKVKITKTYYVIRRGEKRYRYLKLIVNLPNDEKLMNVDYVYVLTPDEYEALMRALGNGKLSTDKSKPTKNVNNSLTTRSDKSSNT